MKTCGYCGRENEDAVVFCRECGTEFDSAVPEPEDARQFEAEPISSDVEPDEEAALCPHCLFANRPEREWCKQCGTPIRGISLCGPFESALAYGCMWRGAVSGRPKPLVLLGAWLFCFPASCAGAFVVLCGAMMGSLFIAVLGLVYTAIPASLLYQITRNFVKIPKPRLDL